MTARSRGPWALTFERLRVDRIAVLSALFLTAIILMAVAAPLIAQAVGHPRDITYSDIAVSLEGVPTGPSRAFLLGVDPGGRDVLVRLAYGARMSLLAGIVSSVLAMAIGVVVGIVSGYYGGVVDTLLSRTMDIMLSLPLLLFAIALVALVDPGSYSYLGVIVFAAFSWAPVARVLRGQTLSLRESKYVQAARSLGAGDARIMFVEILPNLTATVIVYTTLCIPAAIVFEASLSFLNLGAPPPIPTWGNMIADSAANFGYWWYLGAPSLALLLTTVAFNLLGDSLRDATDPRHAGAASTEETARP